MPIPLSTSPPVRQSLGPSFEKAVCSQGRLQVLFKHVRDTSVHFTPRAHTHLVINRLLSGSTAGPLLVQTFQTLTTREDMRMYTPGLLRSLGMRSLKYEYKYETRSDTPG
jgi:hypothetical protein